MGGSIPRQQENLLDAAQGELYEHSEMYPEFERIAREEALRKSPTFSKPLPKLRNITRGAI